MLDLVILIAGFLPLTYGADTMVKGASSLARRMNIPDIVIGLTLVAFGTSAPELVVNVVASAHGTSDIALGNVLGSNIFNIMAILGLSAMVRPLVVQSSTTWIEIPLAVLAAFLVLVMTHDGIVDGSAVSMISRSDGIVLLSFFIIFLVYNFQLMKKGRPDDEEDDGRVYGTGKSILFIILGLVLLALGGQLIVSHAVAFARYVGVPERIIGITIVSVGTSLPELAASVAAARRNATDIAVGNIVGSNLFNTFLILGTSAVILPLPLKTGVSWDMIVSLGAAVLLFTFTFTGGRHRLDRWEGVVFFCLFLLYLASLIFVR